MHIKAILTTAVVALSLAACTNNNNDNGSGPSAQVLPTEAGNQEQVAAPSAPALPSFTMQDVNGAAVNLQDFKGKKVFVNLWASWCPPCRAEMPSIQKLAQSVDTSEVAFVLLALDDDFTKSKSFMQKEELSLPIYYPGDNLPQLFNVPGIPATFIFNEKGELIKHIEGGDDYDTDTYRQILQ